MGPSNMNMVAVIIHMQPDGFLDYPGNMYVHFLPS